MDDSEQVIGRKFGRATRWISLPEHSGAQSVPNNAGIQVAAGTHIAYLGHNDIWSPHHWNCLQRFLKIAARISLSAGAFIMDRLAQGIINSPVFSRQSPASDAAGKGGGSVNLNERRLQNLPARARYFRNVSVLMRNRRGRAKNDAINWLVAQVPGLIDRGFLRYQFLGADHVRCHDIMILNLGGN